jgi:hypothetical protein
LAFIGNVHSFGFFAKSILADINNFLGAIWERECQEQAPLSGAGREALSRMQVPGGVQVGG